MSIFSKLRHTAAGLCLAAGMTTAQAALTIHFEEDVASGHLNVFFGGAASAPSLAMTNPAVSFEQFMTGVAFVLNPTGYQAEMPNWIRDGELPWTSDLRTAISYSGTGGIFSTTSHTIYSTDGSGNIVWDGTAAYNTNLAAIGLSDGASGSFSLTNGIDTITVDWSAVIIPVPEPATYAAVLGLGVAGIALLRRRTNAAK